MPETTRTLAELSAQADVTPRTVRFYIAQGLLPSPARPGPGAKYGDEHLHRLQLIRRLQREHLPLAEIRHRLDELSEDQLEDLLATPEPPRSSALDYIRGHLAERPATHYRPDPSPSFMPAAAPPRVQRVQAERPIPTGLPPEPPSQRSTWERLELTPDIEIHVRRPLDRRTNRALEKILESARDILRSE